LIIANRALCLQKQGKTLEALTDINNSIKLNENYSKAYLRRGHIHKALGNFEEARYDYERYRQKEPSNSETKQLIEECKREEKQAKKKDYYKILGVNKNSTADEIKKAYKKLAPKWHPDKNNGSEEQRLQAEKMFKDIGEAFQVLSDPKKKQMYDNGMDPNDPNSGFDFGGGGGGVDPSEIFKVFFGGGGNGGGFGGEHSFFSGGGNPFSSGGFGQSSSSERGGRKQQGKNPFGGGFEFFFNR